MGGNGTVDHGLDGIAENDIRFYLPDPAPQFQVISCVLEWTYSGPGETNRPKVHPDSVQRYHGFGVSGWHEGEYLKAVFLECLQKRFPKVDQGINNHL
jgi:hypothetical protein